MIQLADMVRVVAVDSISKEFANIKVDVEDLASEIRLRVEARMAAMADPKEVITTTDRKLVFERPSSWWQHFKQDAMPLWFTRLFPVRMETIERAYTETTIIRTTRMCPHIASPGYERHLRFLSLGSDE